VLPALAAGALLFPASALATPLVPDPAASISGTPAVGQQLNCDGGFDNFDFGADSRSNDWFRDGVAITGASGDWLSHAAYFVTVQDAGHDITCRNTATNADGTVTSDSGPVSIPVVKPESTGGVTLITGGTGGGGAIGDVLTCDEGTTWAGGGNITVTHEWKRDGVTVATGGTYTVTVADANHTLSCSEIATNTAGSSSADSQSFGVSDSDAAIVTRPHISGTPTVGQTLSCDGASFSGSNLSDPTYSWSREGTTVGTATTYTLVAADADRQVRCAVVVSNSSSNVEADSEDVTVASGLPQNTVRPQLRGTGHPGSALTCSPGAWTGAGLTYRYQWLLDDKKLAGATRSRLMVTDADVDKALVCKVTATGDNGSTSANSKPVVGFAPAITTTLPKPQPALPSIRTALSQGITSTLACNVSCTSSSHIFIFTSLARQRGIGGLDRGGFVIVGEATTSRTYGGKMTVTTKFYPAAARKLAGLSKLQLDILFETSYGPVYKFKKYHVATPERLVLTR
jgi:hypothetical protein